MKATDLLNESPEAPETEAQPEGMDTQIEAAISAVPCCANLSPEELNEVVTAVMGVVNGEEKGEPEPAEDNSDFETMLEKKPHPLGKQFE